MLGTQATPSGISCNAAVSACEKGDEWEQASILLSPMPEIQVTPNEFSSGAAISACKRGGEWK